MQRDSITIAIIVGIVAIVIADMIVQPTDGIQSLVTAIIGAVIGYLSHAMGVQSGSFVAQQATEHAKEVPPLTPPPAV